MAKASVGIDVGGTWIRAGVVDDRGVIHDRRRIPTPQGDADELVSTLANVVGAGDATVGVGIAGLVAADGALLTSPNLGIGGVPVAERLTALTSRTVVVANDASVAALAEQRFGAGRGVADLLLITVGTGVGGGIVAGGSLHLGANGFAGEIGHVRVEQGGRRCGCGAKGCLEAYASGSAIAAATRERVAGTVSTSLSSIDEPTTEDVVAAAEAGDRVGRELLHEAGGWLGVAAAIATNLLDPEVILVGGGAGTAAASWLLPAARTVLTRQILGGDDRRRPPRLDIAVLGDDAGVIGAAALADRDLGA